MQTPPNGIITKPSNVSVAATMDKLENALKSKGVTIYARIDQQKEASKSGLELPPTELLIFGNPKAGVPIMKSHPLAGLDLPLKALVWQDEQQKVWLSYNSLDYLKKRHDLPDEIVKNINVGPLLEQAIQ